MSLPEILIWQEIRRLQLGFRFRRQHRIDPFVLDFYCVEVKLDIEIDSAWHDGRHSSDEARDSYLLGKSVCVLRMNSTDVLDRPENCAIWIGNACEEVRRWRELGGPPGFRSRQGVKYP